MATNVNVNKAVSITNSVFTGISTNNITSADISAKNLNTYKNIVFIAPFNYKDLSRITQAIDAGISVSYEDINRNSQTIPAGVLKK